MLTLRRRAVLGTALLTLGLGLGVSADHTVVTNKGGSTITIFDSTTNTELPGSPVTVGTGVSMPVDVTADQPPNQPVTKWFVADSGSNSVTAIWSNPVGVAANITTDGFFGSLVTPSGVALITDTTIGPAIAVVDQQTTTYPTPFMPGSMSGGRSTVRFINPVTNAVVDAFQEPSATARYTHVAYTSNNRLWIADNGDQGVTVLFLNSPLGTSSYVQPINYQGNYQYADFVRDTATPRTFLVAPKRLATDGASVVVVADGGSSKVTLLDANYTSTGVIGEADAIKAHVDLSLVVGAPPAGTFTCVSAAVAGGFAYVTTNNLSGAGFNCYQINLTTFAATGVALAGAGGVGGLGVTSDGSKLYVAEGPGGTNGFRQLSITPSTNFALAPVVIPAFTGGAVPFGFFSSAVGTSPGLGAPLGGGGSSPGHSSFASESTTGSTSHAGCGLLGLEGALLLVGLAAFRRS
jgi:hypothetical protein